MVAKFFVLKLRRLFCNEAGHSEETGTPWGPFSSLKIFGEDDLTQGWVGLNFAKPVSVVLSVRKLPGGY